MRRYHVQAAELALHISQCTTLLLLHGENCCCRDAVFQRGFILAGLLSHMVTEAVSLPGLGDVVPSMDFRVAQ